MRKKTFQHQHVLYRYYKKFCNLQKRISLLMQSGEFFNLSHEIRHRLVRRLTFLFERIERLAGKQKLRWAGAALALILSASVAKAQFNDTISLSGFMTPSQCNASFCDFEGDGDLDITLGNTNGTVSYILNNNGEYSHANDNPFSGFDVGYASVTTMGDLDDDGDLDLVVGEYDGQLFYFTNDAGVFTEVTGVDNPFNGFDVGYNAYPLLFDFDEDDDLDMICGDYYGAINYFDNDGGVFTEMIDADNPFDGIDIGQYSAPYIVDFDDDSDLDLVVGDGEGTISYYQNDAGVFTEQTGTDNPFNGIDIGTFAAPALGDFDDDGDIDLAVGDFDSEFLRYFRNDGGTLTEKRGQPNPFEGLLGYMSAAPAFSDVDEDGDLDMLMGEAPGNLKYYENTGEGLVPRFDADNPFNAFTPGSYPKPVFEDVDGDGDEDLVVGDYDGILHYYSKEDASDYDEMIGVNNPFNGIDVTDNAAPAFVDFDDDGDLDLFVGGKYEAAADVYVGTLSYFRNNSGVFIQQTGTDNPLENIFTTNPGGGFNPVFHDVDQDGDEDLFIGLKSGTYGGTLKYVWNDDGTYALTDSRNPFLDIFMGIGVAPTFADVDGDGDKDLYAGILTLDDGGEILFAESTQGPPEAVPVITEAAIRIYSQDKTIFLDAGDELLNRVEVYNLAGTLITSKTVNAAGLYELNLPDALSGLYLVRAYSDGESSTGKVLIR